MIGLMRNKGSVDVFCMVIMVLVLWEVAAILGNNCGVQGKNYNVNLIWTIYCVRCLMASKPGSKHSGPRPFPGWIMSQKFPVDGFKWEKIC